MNTFKDDGTADDEDAEKQVVDENPKDFINLIGCCIKSPRYQIYTNIYEYGYINMYL